MPYANALGIEYACVRGAIWHLSFVDALIVSARALLSVKVSPRLARVREPKPECHCESST